MKITHGMKISNDHEGVNRQMSLQRYEDNGDTNYLIMIETTHQNEEPIKTNLALSEYGYAMFCEFMRVAPAQLSNFKIKESE